MERAAVGAVLAGGRSRRMGGPKALAELAGRPLISYPLAAVEAAGLEPLVVAKPDSALPPLGCRVVREPVDPPHPLRGVLTALDEAGGRAVIALGCDMPLLRAELLEWLAGLDERAAVPEVGGRLQPLLARYEPSAAPALKDALERGAAMRDAVCELGPRIVGEAELARFGEPESMCMNVNAPPDLERAAALLADQPHAQPDRAAAARTAARVEHDGVTDEVAVEEPLEIRVDGRPLAVTMRTPGEDEELALGFLFGEGLIEAPREAGPPPDLAANTVEVAGPLLRDPGERRFYTTSSCGVCGKGALEEVAVHSAPLPDGPRVDRGLIAALPERLRQPAFERTGGVHAAGLFDSSGALLCAREDVGRHNAMDKVIGRALLDGRVPLRDRILCVSGRLAFELVQKAAVAGAPILVGVGAPTSLAVELAAERGMTLCGFARAGKMNVYSRPDRVADRQP